MPRRSRWCRPLMALLLLGALWTPARALASLLVPLDTAQLVARAERIVVGTVLGQTSRWTDDHGTIFTDVRIRVDWAMLGAKEGDVITVRRLGGTVQDVGMRVFGEASFSDGEEVMLFSERRGDAHYSVGMTQGTLHIAVEGNRKIAHTALAGAELLGRATQQGAVARPLEEVWLEVRTALAARAAGKPQQKIQPEGKR